MVLKDVIYLQHDSSCWCMAGSSTVVLMGKFELQTRVPAVETEIVKQGIWLQGKKSTSQVLL